MKKKRLKTSFDEGQDALDRHLALPKKRANLRVSMPLTAGELKNLIVAVSGRAQTAAEQHHMWPEDGASHRLACLWQRLQIRLEAQLQRLEIIKKLERQKLRQAKSNLRGRARK